jgi:hypothetical protein
MIEREKLDCYSRIKIDTVFQMKRFDISFSVRGIYTSYFLDNIGTVVYHLMTSHGDIGLEESPCALQLPISNSV